MQQKRGCGIQEVGYTTSAARRSESWPSLVALAAPRGTTALSPVELIWAISISWLLWAFKTTNVSKLGAELPFTPPPPEPPPPPRCILTSDPTQISTRVWTNTLRYRWILDYGHQPPTLFAIGTAKSVDSLLAAGDFPCHFLRSLYANIEPAHTRIHRHRHEYMNKFRLSKSIHHSDFNKSEQPGFWWDFDRT